jgi:hypothetical protein
MNSVTLNATSSSNSSIDNLTAYISAIDADGDNITYAYNWYKNNTLNATTLITNGLVAYYPLNNDTLDYYGSNDGTNINSTQVDGKVGNSYSFNGTSSRLSLPNNPVFETNTQGTISAWVKMYSSSDYATIYAYSDSASANYFMQFMLSFRRVVGYVRQQDGTNYIRITSNTPLNVGQLYYVVWTNNGTNYSIYVDGVLQNITLLSEGVGLEGDWFEKIKDNAENSNIGALERTSLNSYFNGTIDELMIYNRSLTASEVKQLYDGSRNGGNNLSSDLTSTGDVWKVGVTPADSLYWGNELNSSTITILNSCTPPSTNNDWQVFWSDNCVLSSNTNLGTGTLYLYGDVTGTFTLNANLTARKRILMPITNAKFIQLPGSKLILA